MGFMDNLKNAMSGAPATSGGLGGLLSSLGGNPQIASALASLLSSGDTSVGGNGGLAGLVAAFQRNGLGHVVSQWISTGPNPPVTGEQVTQALGHDTMNQFAAKAGVPVSQAGSLLAGLLPAAVDHLTPDGRMPEVSSIEGALSSLLSGFGSRG